MPRDGGGGSHRRTDQVGAPAGTLPRFELKAKRWIHKMNAPDAK
jgi:hypothetical protein